MSIDSLLYRPLIATSQFEGLIPKYQGKETALDKSSDNSTTYDTLKFMSDWATKYAYQMNKVAPKLKGASLQETVNNIYKFLYNHFQYKLDGSVQNLFSPSAAWHFRKTGFDCKTYSILASCILQNLNIKHSFRMVQQAGIMPGEWSHVYVVVPNGNSEYVIDATKHSNTEVSYTKKHDYTMIHKGLAAPAVIGALGCACSGKKIALGKGLGAPSTLENTISNYHAFLNELEKRGVSRVYTDRMLELVKANVQNGIDPDMQEVVKKAFSTPAGQLGVDFSSYSTPSLSLASSQGYSLTSNSVLTQGSVLSSGSSSTGSSSNLLSGVSSMASNINVGGVSVGSAISAATSLLAGNPTGILSLVTSLIPVGKTFGAVFANGFNLACWGSTAPPSVTKTWGEHDFPMVLNETLGKGITVANLNMYLDAMNRLETISRNWAADMKSCSKDGLNSYAEAAKTAKEGVIEGVRSALAQQNIQMIQTTSITSSAIPPFTFSDNTFTTAKDPYTSERFNIIMPTNSQNQSNDSKTNSDGSPDVKSSSSLIPILVGGAVLAAKFLI